MLSTAIASQVRTRESSGQKLWTSEARNDVLGFLAQSLGLACAAVFLYSLGPALGMALIAVSFAVWSLLRSQIAFEEEEDSPGEDVRHTTAVDSPSQCANPAWLRNLGLSSVSTARSVMRQGA